MSGLVKRINDQRGVTLIELLAVIVILGIIAAVAVPAVMSNFSDAKAKSDEQTEAIVKDAVLRYILMETVSFNATTGKATITIADLKTKGYLQDSPKWSTGNDVGDVAVTKGSNGEITFDASNIGNPTK